MGTDQVVNEEKSSIGKIPPACSKTYEWWGNCHESPYSETPLLDEPLQNCWHLLNPKTVIYLYLSGKSIFFKLTKKNIKKCPKPPQSSKFCHPTPHKFEFSHRSHCTHFKNHRCALAWVRLVPQPRRSKPQASPITSDKQKIHGVFSSKTLVFVHGAHIWIYMTICLKSKEFKKKHESRSIGWILILAQYMQCKWWLSCTTSHNSSRSSPPKKRRHHRRPHTSSWFLKCWMIHFKCKNDNSRDLHPARWKLFLLNSLLMMMMMMMMMMITMALYRNKTI